MTQAIIKLNRSTDIVKHSVLNLLIYFLIGYITFNYLLWYALMVSNILGAVLFTVSFVAIMLTFFKLLSLFLFKNSTSADFA